MSLVTDVRAALVDLLSGSDIRILFRRGTPAEWAAANPVLGAGEPGYELVTRKEKRGDGITPWNSLGYRLDFNILSLVLAASPELIAVGAITRSSTYAATSFSVVWPDGATGAFTGTESITSPGAIDAYTVTHVLDGTTVTYTQPAVTRDSTGNVTNRPAITVS